MGEWFVIQKQSNSNFCSLVQERIEKATPCRKLNAGESKRLRKLGAIADKLEHRETVQNLQLQTWLSK